MQKNWIKNFKELATNDNRKLALTVAEAGLQAIDTESVILNTAKLENNILNIEGKSFDLAKFQTIKIIGFGKSSCDGAMALEKILGDKIKEGAVVGLSKMICGNIETFAGTHPRPSHANIIAGEKIYNIAKDSGADDLIIVLVSGGGSALLCYDENECDQGARLYDSFLGSGKTINEINTVRKHLSILKGGGLAKIAYPATVVALVFSDVPGDKFSDVASGPTYKDESTIADAERIIKESNLGEFNLIETPKEDKYFEKVHNFVLVSNKTAVEAMKVKAEELGLGVSVASTNLYDEVDESIKKIFSKKDDNTIVLAAGEPRITLKDKKGKGGRNLHIALETINKGMIDEDSVFIALASDGMDNSDVAGAIIDKTTLENVKKLNLNAKDYIDRFDSYSFFGQAGDTIMTGPTGANVSDLMILLTKN